MLNMHRVAIDHEMAPGLYKPVRRTCSCVGCDGLVRLASDTCVWKFPAVHQVLQSEIAQSNAHISETRALDGPRC